MINDRMPHLHSTAALARCRFHVYVAPSLAWWQCATVGELNWLFSPCACDRVAPPWKSGTSFLPLLLMARPVVLEGRRWKWVRLPPRAYACGSDMATPAAHGLASPWAAENSQGATPGSEREESQPHGSGFVARLHPSSPPRVPFCPSLADTYRWRRTLDGATDCITPFTGM